MAKGAYIGVPTLSASLGEFEVGATVKMNVNGEPREFIIVQKGNPDSSKYDASCDGIWLLMKDLYVARAYSSSTCNYNASSVHTYLNGTFLGCLDAGVQSAIKQVKIPYCTWNGSSRSDFKGEQGLSTKVFLLSAGEVNIQGGYVPSEESVQISYFVAAPAEKRIAYFNGNVGGWWTRTPYCRGTTTAAIVNIDGSSSNNSANGSGIYVRPAMILPADTGVRGGFIDGSKPALIPVARKVKKGYIGVPTLSDSLGELEVGSTIKLNVSGAAKDFIVVQQGTPSNLYDASCNGTWLLMKDIYTKMGWGIMRNVYADSNIHSNLNGTFLGALDAHVQSAIKQVKIPYVNGVGNGGTVASGSNGLSTKVFLLSGYELGWTGSDFPKDGACLAYFNGASAYDDRYKLKYNGTATGWWMRSPYPYDNTSAFCVDANGSWNGYNVGGSYGVRPAFVLPSNLSISNGTIDGTEAGTKDVARKIKKAYIGIDGVARLCWEAQPDIVTFTVYQNKTDAFTFTMPSGMTFDEAISAGYANGYNANGDTMILMNDNANGYLMRQIRYVAGQLRGSGSVYTDTSRATRAYITDTPIEGNFYDSSGGVVAS